MVGQRTMLLVLSLNHSVLKCTVAYCIYSGNLCLCLSQRKNHSAFNMNFTFSFRMGTLPKPSPDVYQKMSRKLASLVLSTLVSFLIRSFKLPVPSLLFRSIRNCWCLSSKAPKRNCLCSFGMTFSNSSDLIGFPRQREHRVSQHPILLECLSFTHCSEVCWLWRWSKNSVPVDEL